MHFQTDPASRLAVTEAAARESWVRGHSDLVVSVFDPDTRRWLNVTCRKAHSFIIDNDLNGLGSDDFFEMAAPMFAAIRAELDAGPPNLTALVVTLDGEVLSRSTDPYDDITPSTHYASVGDYQIPAHIKTLARDELVEVTRLVAFADVVIPASSSSADEERLVFKHYQHVFGLQDAWNAIHIGAKLSTHPHIAPVRHLIVDETDRSRVVGFTVPFFPGGDLWETRRSRPFKLKWAKQLFGTLDDLHLKHGVFHGDIKIHNMVIDPATDNLTLIDFGCSAKIGTPAYAQHHQAALSPVSPEHNPLCDVADDVRCAIRAVYGLVRGMDGHIETHSAVKFSYTAIPFETVKKGGWVKGPHVKLDSPAEDYYRVAMDWLRERNNGPKITQHNQASEPLDYPDYMPPPQVDIDAYQREKARKLAELANTQPGPGRGHALIPSLTTPQRSLKLTTDPELLEEMYGRGGCTDWEQWWKEVTRNRDATSGRYFLRVDAIEAGCPFLNWERPSTAHLDRTRRLLANGKYEDKQAGANAKTNKRKREDGEEEENRDAGDARVSKIGKTSETTNIAITKRITRSATKQAIAAAPPALKSKPKPKPARKTTAPKGRKAVATGTTTKKARPQGATNGK
jgi:hypothetical protein